MENATIYIHEGGNCRSMGVHEFQGRVCLTFDGPHFNARQYTPVDKARELAEAILRLCDSMEGK